MYWQQTKRVALTYLTQRWLLLLPGFILLATGGAYFSLLIGGKGAEHLQATFGLGLPSMMGLFWLVVDAKWQFANPRARLIPDYASPHLGVLTALLVLTLVANPICFSRCGGLSTLGALAYALLLGGLVLWGMQPGRNFLTLLAIAIFFSGFSETGLQFWFAIPNRFAVLHVAMAVTGAALVAAWLWRLSLLHEEMDDYQIIPMGMPGGYSRLERAEQRKLLGRISARRGAFQYLSDRWHDRLESLLGGIEKRHRLLQYGFGRISGVSRAIFTGFGFAAYGIFLSKVGFASGKTTGQFRGQMAMAIIFAAGIPAFGAGLLMLVRLPRMAHELLRPATRAEYFDGLFLSLAKLCCWIWLGLQIGLLAIMLATGSFPDENLSTLAGAYAFLSLATQVPAIGFTLWMSRKSSYLRLILTLYAVIFPQMAVLAAWWFVRKELGDLLTVTLFTAMVLAAGAKLIAVARRAWLRVELG